MRRGSFLVVLVAGAVLVLAVGGQSRSADNPMLTGTVGPAFTITLLGSDGQPVSTLVEGTYTINISDRSSNHDFHLFGPGINQTTSVTDTGDTTWTVNLTPGGYAFVCDPHVGAAMRGTFSVVPVTKLAAPLAKKQVVGSTPRTRGTGSFFATLARSSTGGATLSWNLAFVHLTGGASTAEVHLGTPGHAGNLVVSLCKACESGAKGTVAVPADALAPLLNGRTYVSVTTTKNPNGELRGQLYVVGE